MCVEKSINTYNPYRVGGGVGGVDFLAFKYISINFAAPNLTIVSIPINYSIGHHNQEGKIISRQNLNEYIENPPPNPHGIL